MHRRIWLIVLTALMLPMLASSQTSPVDSKAAFERLRGLIGSWDMAEKGRPGNAELVTYSMTGRGSVLVEQFQNSTSTMGHMLTAYHLDVGQLVLTHFCGAGNQPRMRVKAFDDGGKHIAFEMYDITNLADPNAYHSTKVDVNFLSDDRIDLVYRGVTAGKETNQVFQLTRKSH
jgi:hypothetical protein